MIINKKKILIINYKKKIKKNYIPCIIYNKNYNSKCYINLSEINKIIKNKKYIIFLKKKKNKKLVLIKDIQYNILRNKILHIDFFKINNNNTLFVTYVNIKIIGNSINFFKGAICNIILKKIKIKTNIKNYPEYFIIDITKLNIGNKIFIKDLKKKYNNIKFLHSLNQIIISIKRKKIIKDDNIKINKDKNIKK